MQDPSNRWLVYDLMSELPAEVSGRLLMGLTQGEAERLAKLANAGFAIQATRSPAASFA